MQRGNLNKRRRIFVISYIAGKKCVIKLQLLVESRVIAALTTSEQILGNRLGLCYMIIYDDSILLLHTVYSCSRLMARVMTFIDDRLIDKCCSESFVSKMISQENYVLKFDFVMAAILGCYCCFKNCWKLNTVRFKQLTTLI